MGLYKTVSMAFGFGEELWRFDFKIKPFLLIPKLVVNSAYKGHNVVKRLVQTSKKQKKKQFSITFLA